MARYDTRADIEAQLAAGEDGFAEFKEVRLKEGGGVVAPNTEDIAGELVAFANAEGGAIFLGVDDTGIVRGIAAEALGRVEQWIVNVATNNCEPPIRPLVRKLQLTNPNGEELPVLLCEVRRGLFVHRTSGGRYYLRVGSSKRDLTPAELACLFQERGRTFVFDEQIVPAGLAEDLDQAMLAQCFGARPSIPWPDLLRNTKATAVDDAGMERPTVAGLLCFGREPRVHLPMAYIEAAVYRGARLHSDELVHAEAIDGSLSQQIDDAVAFVDRFMLRPARKDVGRQDLPQYRLDVIHEAIVNAVAHRDYSISGAKIRLFLFADRLELYSPGGLPNTLTLETMPFRVFTRNQLVVSFLSRLKSRRGRAFLESRGEGVRRILEEGAEYAGRRPEYRLLGDELLLTFWAAVMTTA